MLLVYIPISIYICFEMELIIGIHTTTIPKISAFFLVDVNYHICECNIYRFLLDYLIASYLSHLSSY